LRRPIQVQVQPAAVAEINNRFTGAAVRQQTGIQAGDDKKEMLKKLFQKRR
jgi:hypothetical protein